MAKVCIVSSLVEGFPNVLLQMMSQNEKDSINHLCGGIENINGLFTCSPNNIDALAQKINEALFARNTNGNKKNV